MSRAAALLFGLCLVAGCFPPEETQPEPGQPVEASDAGLADGGSGGTGGGFPSLGQGAPQVVIQNYTFAPVELLVSPGDTVRFTNLDGDAHTVTSETFPGTYALGQVNGVWFDIAAFTGTRTFKIPETAPHGTVIYYFDRVCTNRMKNQPRITIR